MSKHKKHGNPGKGKKCEDPHLSKRNEWPWIMYSFFKQDVVELSTTDSYFLTPAGIALTKPQKLSFGCLAETYP